MYPLDVSLPSAKRVLPPAAGCDRRSVAVVAWHLFAAQPGFALISPPLSDRPSGKTTVFNAKAGLLVSHWDDL